jgi:hypothetical protein
MTLIDWLAYKVIGRLDAGGQARRGVRDRHRQHTQHGSGLSTRRRPDHRLHSHTVAEALDEPPDAILNLVMLRTQEAATLTPLVRRRGMVVSATVPIEPAAGSSISDVTSTRSPWMRRYPTPGSRRGAARS